MNHKIALLLIIVILINGCDNKVDKVSQPSSIKEIALGKEIPSEASSFSRNKGGACGFDKPQISGNYQFVSGWALISKDTLADGLYIGILANDVERFTPILNREKRVDVAKYFNNENVINSGFVAYFKKYDVPIGAKATLYQTFQGGIYPCEVTITF